MRRLDPSTAAEPSLPAIEALLPPIRRPSSQGPVASSTLRQLNEWQTLFGNDVATSIVSGARVSLLPGSQLPHRRPPEFHGSQAAEECIASEIEDLLDKGAIRALPPSA